MAESLPLSFPIPAEAVISSFTFTELLTNVGYLKFYLGATSEWLTSTTKTTTYIATPNVYFPETTESSYSATIGETPSAKITINFDSVEFKKPLTIEGTALFTMPLKVTQGSAGAEGWIKTTVQRWDGSSATTIGSKESEPQVNSGTKQMTTQISLTKTSFSIGDQLRIKIEVYAKAQTGVGTTVGFSTQIAYDPQGRDTTNFTPSSDNTLSTISNIIIPFKVDL